MDKKMISHAIAILTTPFYFSFLLAIGYALYYKEYTNIFAGTPIIIFMTLFLFMFAAPFILLLENYSKKIKLPSILKVMFVTGLMTFILSQLFFQKDSMDYTIILLGTISGCIYYFNELIVTKYILNKLKFLNEHC